MKKSKWKKSQIVRPAPSKEKTLNIQQKKPQIYEQFINHKIMDDITIELIKEKINLIHDELTWIENHLSSIQGDVEESNAKGVIGGIKPPALVDLGVKEIVSNKLQGKSIKNESKRHIR